ncbi:hypothetical protein JCM14469_27530 [Desulfatiferula olefinivorans]
MKQTSHIRSERGSVVLFVLVVLVLVSLYGITSLNTASSELMIAGNNRVYKQNLYRAEAAIMEVGRLLQLEAAPETNLKPVNSSLTWLTDGTAASPTFDPETGTWVFGTNAQLSALYADNASGYAVVFEGVAAGGSLNMTGPRMWQYGVYGLSQLNGGRVGVVSGYRRMF